MLFNVALDTRCFNLLSAVSPCLNGLRLECVGYIPRVAGV